MLWQVVGVAAVVIGYAAEVGGFELEMRRAASKARDAVTAQATRRGLLPLGVGDPSYRGTDTDRRANDRVRVE